MTTLVWSFKTIHLMTTLIWSRVYGQNVPAAENRNFFPTFQEHLAKQNMQSEVIVLRVAPPSHMATSVVETVPGKLRP